MNGHVKTLLTLGVLGVLLLGGVAWGFGAGKVGNAAKGTTIPFAQVWTSNPSNPAVQLVLSRLGPQATAVRKHHAGAGVVVMVGAGFEQLVDGQSSIKVTKRTSICSPPAT